MSNQLLHDFYDISEICDDDLIMVCELISFYHTPQEKFSRIKSDILEHNELTRIEKYHKTFQNILSFDIRHIKHFLAIKRGRVRSQVIKIKRVEIKCERVGKNMGHKIESLFDVV